MNSNLPPFGFPPQTQQAAPHAMPPSAPGVTPDTLNIVLQPAFDALEIERQRAKEKVKSATTMAVIIGIAILVMGLVGFGGGAIGFIFLASLIVGAIIVGVASAGANNDYSGGFKNLVIRHIMSAVNPSLVYSPGSYISESEFRMCQMFRNPDRYRGEDLVEGTVGATRLRFSEIHAEYESRHTDSKGHTSTSYHTMFRGLFFIADFNKNFNGVTLILPDNSERFLGHLSQSLQSLGAKLSFSGRELVKLEDPEFEKDFIVYSRDQIEASYLLSPALMRRLLALSDKAGGAFHLAFIANQIYLALPMREDLFEPPSMNTPLDASCVSKYVEQLGFVLGIVEDLDLNTRIWSKGAGPGQPAQGQSPQGQPPLPDQTATAPPMDPLQPGALHVWENR